jgi:hypothetical protein
MPLGIYHADEKYTQAVNLMAVWDEPLRARLSSAYTAVIGDRDPGKSVSAEVRERIETLHQRMTGVLTIGEEGRIAATVEAMDEDQLREAAEEFFAIFLALRAECWEFMNRARLKPDEDAG